MGGPAPDALPPPQGPASRGGGPPPVWDKGKGTRSTPGPGCEGSTACLSVLWTLFCSAQSKRGGGRRGKTQHRHACELFLGPQNERLEHSGQTWQSEKAIAGLPLSTQPTPLVAKRTKPGIREAARPASGTSWPHRCHDAPRTPQTRSAAQQRLAAAHCTRLALSPAAPHATPTRTNHADVPWCQREGPALPRERRFTGANTASIMPTADSHALCCSCSEGAMVVPSKQRVEHAR
jgi:hypothetical protein